MKINRPAPTGWGDKLPFNTVCGEFSSGRGGWVHSVAFSPSGDALAFAGHDSSVNLVYPQADGNHTLLSITANTLPFRSLIWTNEQQIVAAGFDCAPILYETKDGQDWHYAGSLDVGRKKISHTSSVLARFKTMDSRGETENDTTLSTVHQNTINEIRVYAGARDNVTKFSTCGVDGKVVIWDFEPSQLVADLSSLKI